MSICQSNFLNWGNSILLLYLYKYYRTLNKLSDHVIVIYERHWKNSWQEDFWQFCWLKVEKLVRFIQIFLIEWQKENFLALPGTVVSTELFFLIFNNCFLFYYCFAVFRREILPFLCLFRGKTKILQCFWCEIFCYWKQRGYHFYQFSLLR